MIKRILVSAQDAGGAVNIAPVCCKLIEQNFKLKIFSSNITKYIFSSYDLTSKIINNFSVNEYYFERTLNEFNPNIILTGTTRFFSVDRILIKLAKKYNITSISILDDWSNYLLRFKDENGDIILPDFICCMDDLAYYDAINQGIPASNLMITGSPYLSLLFDKKKYYNSIISLNDLFKCEGISINLPKILFISENHSEDYGTNQIGGKMGEFLGFTEKTVLKDLIDIILELNSECILIEKLHPASKIVKNFSSKIDKIFLIKLKNINLHQLIISSDIVIGMRSIALLESAILDKRTISYQPNLNPNYGLSTVERIAKIESLRTKKELKSLMNIFFENRLERKFIYFKKRPKFADKNAINNIVKLIKEKL